MAWETDWETCIEVRKESVAAGEPNREGPEGCRPRERMRAVMIERRRAVNSSFSSPSESKLIESWRR
jgi:hypothetical protein